MNNVEYNYLINNYQRSAVKICIEKCCDYKFIFFLNEYQTLGDLYNYVISNDLFCDEVHQTLSGNKQIAKYIYDSIDKIIKK